jgi:fructoselysine-6-P-deglycase FrlB-like protein
MKKTEITLLGCGSSLELMDIGEKLIKKIKKTIE